MRQPLLLLGALITVTVAMPRLSADAVVVVSSEVNRAEKDAAEKPAQSYALAVSEFIEIGDLPARVTPVSRETIADLVTLALPTESWGARVAWHAEPEVVLACHYGEVSPVGPQFPVPGKPGGRVSATRALLLGRGIVPLLRPSLADSLRTEAGDDRFFLVITAYDGAELRQGREVVRWQTRVSADSLRNDVRGVWVTLTQVAVEHAGQHLRRPELVLREVPSPVDREAGQPVPRLAELLSKRAVELETAIF